MSYRISPNQSSRQPQAPPVQPSNQPQGPSGNDPVDLTIANQVTRIADGAPATQLITVLLKHVAIDVGTFTRDVHSSSQVYFRSLKVYDDIQRLIARVEGSTDVDAPSWDAFDSYTGAIPILERILFNFYSLFYTESKNDRREHLPPISGVDSAFIFIETWRKDRKMLRDTLIGLADTKFLSLSPDIKKYLQANPQIQRSHDDVSTIRAFSMYFSANLKTLTDRDIVQPRNQRLVTAVRVLVDGIIAQCTKSPAAEETSRIVIMSLMIAYIPFSMLASDKTDQGWRDYLKTAAIWTAIKNLLESVDKHLKTPGKQPSVSDLDLEWEKVKDLLLKLTPTVIDTKPEILELLKLAANIRRPFHGRSVELIRTLYQLDKYSRENAGVTRYRNDLKYVIDDSITTLEATRDAVGDVRNITLNEQKYTKHETELNATFNKVKDIFTTFGISEEWAAKEQAYHLAATIDTDHLTMMRQRLGADNAARQAA